MTRDTGFPADSPIQRWAARVDQWPRLVRIAVSLLITLELVILVSVLIDRLLLDMVYEGDVGAMTPALIAAGLGLVFYAIGWWAMVGFDSDPNRPWRGGKRAVIWVGIGLAGLVLLIILALFGLAVGYLL